MSLELDRRLTVGAAVNKLLTAGIREQVGTVLLRELDVPPPVCLCQGCDEQGDTQLRILRCPHSGHTDSSNLVFHTACGYCLEVMVRSGRSPRCPLCRHPILTIDETSPVSPHTGWREPIHQDDVVQKVLGLRRFDLNAWQHRRQELLDRRRVTIRNAFSNTNNV